MVRYSRQAFLSVLRRTTIRHVVWIAFVAVVLLHMHWRLAHPVDGRPHHQIQQQRRPIKRGAGDIGSNGVRDVIFHEGLDLSRLRLRNKDDADPSNDHNTIFVSIVSYRDQMCAVTVHSLLTAARNPKNVFLGIVEQRDADKGDPGCVIIPPWDRRDAALGMFGTVKVYYMHPRASKGPIYSRYFAAQLYGGQRYFMMIDSHVKFEPEWDRLLIEMHVKLASGNSSTSRLARADSHQRKEIVVPAETVDRRAGNSSSSSGGAVDEEPLRSIVITVHPPVWIRDPNDEEDALIINNPDVQALSDGKMNFLCEARFDYPELGFPVLQSREVNATSEPMLQPFVAAGFLFTDGSIVEEVPFDPHLPYIFHGEEILLSARLWTSGWDFYAPNVPILYHYYYRTDSKKYWNDTDFPLPEDHWEEQEAATKRIQLLLQTYDYILPSERKGQSLKRSVPDIPPAGEPLAVRQDMSLYDLGVQRRLSSFWSFAGIDMYERRVNRSKWPCGREVPS